MRLQGTRHMNMCVTCEKSQHRSTSRAFNVICGRTCIARLMSTKLRCVRSRNVFYCSCSHCGFIARQLEYNLQTRFASVSHQSLGTAPRVSFNMRTHGWVFRRLLAPGGDKSAIHTSETFNRCVRTSTTVFFTSSSALRCRWRR